MQDEAATNRSVLNVQHWLLSSIRKIKALKLSMPVAEKERFHLACDPGRLDARCCCVCNVGCIEIINHRTWRRWSVLLIKSPFQGERSQRGDWWRCWVPWILKYGSSLVPHHMNFYISQKLPDVHTTQIRLLIGPVGALGTALSNVVLKGQNRQDPCPH